MNYPTRNNSFAVPVYLSKRRSPGSTSSCWSISDLCWWL